MVFPSRREAISGAVDSILDIARECGCVDGSKAGLEIALHEALANAVVHGNAADAAKRVVLRCYANPGDALIVAVRDEGGGFDPAKVPDPRSDDRKLLHHGRGLFLMRELLDHLTYRKGGREVVLYKRVDEVSPEPPTEA